MIQEITYTDANGKPAKVAYMDGKTSAYRLVGGREKYAQLMAQGKSEEEAYCEAYGVELVTERHRQEMRPVLQRLRNDTAVVLRIQELQRPVLRKIAHKIEYNIQKALEQCQVAWDLAYAQGDSKGLLAAVKMQADLSKLLAQEITVNHKHGLLDEETTEVLLALRDEIKVRKEKQKKMMEKKVLSIETVGAAPHQAPFSKPDLVPSEAVRLSPSTENLTQRAPLHKTT